MTVEKAPDRVLIGLRDRCGLLSPETAWHVLQRLTWLSPLTDTVGLMHTAIDDVEESPGERVPPAPLMKRCPAGLHSVINTLRELPCPLCQLHKEIQH